MYVERNVVTRSRNHCPSGNATVPFNCIVELHVSVSSVKILSVAHKGSWGEFMSPATIRHDNCGQTDGHGEANTRFSRHCERA